MNDVRTPWFDKTATDGRGVGAHEHAGTATGADEGGERGRLRAVLDAAPAGIIMVNAEGRIELVNRHVETLFGYAAGDLLDRPVEQLLPARMRASHPGKMRSFFADPSARPMGGGRDLHAVRRDGTEFPVEIALTPFPTSAGMGVLATMVDITERKQSETRLRLANENLEDFVYVASHDLRSPLHGIADLLGWIKEDLGDAQTPSVARNLERIALRITRMEQLLADLLTYARAGVSDAEVHEFDPLTVIEHVLELDPPRPGFEVRTDIPAMLMHAARTPLEIVLRNLIGNAIKHHDRDTGVILATARPRAGAFEFSIADDGPGIPRRAQERIFKLFQTASAPERRGSGVGLAVSKRLVELHGGSISVESTDGQRGTVFRFCWPDHRRDGGHG